MSGNYPFKRRGDRQQGWELQPKGNEVSMRRGRGILGYWQLKSFEILEHETKKRDGVLVLVQGMNEAGFNFISTKREKKNKNKIYLRQYLA